MTNYKTLRTTRPAWPRIQSCRKTANSKDTAWFQRILNYFTYTIVKSNSTEPGYPISSPTDYKITTCSAVVQDKNSKTLLSHITKGNLNGFLHQYKLVSGRLDQRSINRRCYGTIAFGHWQLLEIVPFLMCLNIHVFFNILTSFLHFPLINQEICHEFWVVCLCLPPY